MGENELFGMSEPPQPAHVLAEGRVAATLAEGSSHGLLLWHQNPTATTGQRPHLWIAVDPSKHDFEPITTQAELEALTIRPSIGWMECCGMHGWITDGRWEDC